MFCFMPSLRDFHPQSRRPFLAHSVSALTQPLLVLVLVLELFSRLHEVHSVHPVHFDTERLLGNPCSAPSNSISVNDTRGGPKPRRLITAAHALHIARPVKGAFMRLRLACLCPFSSVNRRVLL